ncbi:flagella synthesis protein FlgN [Sedimenticola thiotaurini]|uniref:Flagellar protein FlgN n=1 Tax=Sedimenticola thiotaurini TaxID=1543721 RepID=A0A0F7JZE1_9GAMM|nr:flagellar protein FlgN [Sedimenticola thiotaurini]AKH20285.1 hypothetical protein AAY24_07900 [Sedimenticola thiotaurini]
MTLSADQQNQLTQALSAEVKCAQTLEEILKREQAALKATDPDQVLEISREKQQAVEQMQAHSRQRERLLTSLGINVDAPDLNRFFQSNSDSACADLWRQLGGIADQLQKQNEINGGILALSQRHNKQALDLLCGRTESRNTYGAKGQQEPDQPGHPLAKA